MNEHEAQAEKDPSIRHLKECKTDSRARGKHQINFWKIELLKFINKN